MATGVTARIKNTKLEHKSKNVYKKIQDELTKEEFLKNFGHQFKNN